MNHRSRTQLCMCTVGGLLVAAAGAAGLSMMVLVAAAGFICGDGICDPAEDCLNCRVDCGPCPAVGACCIWDGSCVDVASQAECAALFGTYQGDGTDCLTADCTPPQGANLFTDPGAFQAGLLATDKRAKASWNFKPHNLPPAFVVGLDDPLNIDTHGLNPDDPWTDVTEPPVSGDCCVAHPTAGCEDPVCAAAVCAGEPFCCDISWDSICATIAAADPACDCLPQGPSTWPPSVDNVTFQSNLGPNPQAPAPNPRGLDGLAFSTAGFLDITNNTLSSNFFVDSFDILSGLPAVPPDNHTAMSIEIVTALSGAPPGPVLVTVYDKNEVPVGKIKVPIPLNPPPPVVNNPLCVGALGDCCIAFNGSPGCDTKGCCSAICNIDSFCCDTTWDSICADEAAADGTNCPQCGGRPPPGVPKKAFLGIIIKDGLTIGRVNLFDLGGGTEGISQITVYEDTFPFSNADITGPGGVSDGCVDAFDLGAMLARWCSAVNDPNPPSPPCENCSPANLEVADIFGPANVPDGCIDAFDLAKLLADWCSVAGDNPCGTCFP